MLHERPQNKLRQSISHFTEFKHGNSVWHHFPCRYDIKHKKKRNAKKVSNFHFIYMEKRNCISGQYWKIKVLFVSILGALSFGTNWIFCHSYSKFELKCRLSNIKTLPCQPVPCVLVCVSGGFYRGVMDMNDTLIFASLSQMSHDDVTVLIQCKSIYFFIEVGFVLRKKNSSHPN